jgi:hypothetical protein
VPAYSYDLISEQLFPFMSAALARLVMSADDPIVVSSDSMHVCPSEVHIVSQLSPCSAKNHFTQPEATNVPSVDCGSHRAQSSTTRK